MTKTERYGYLSERAHRRLCLGFLLLAGVLGGMCSWGVSAITANGDWPYDVLAREIVSDQVPPGGELAMRRRIDYHQEDCWRQYDRRAVSQVQSGPQPGRVERFDAVVEQKLPVDLSGKWQTWATTLPSDFPCGPAYLVESVTAACTSWQRYVRLLRKPDIITPFKVACPTPS